MWRGRNWKSSIPDVGYDRKEADKTDIDNENYKTLLSESLDVPAPCLQTNPAEHVSNLLHDTSISPSSSDVTVDEVEAPCPTKNSKQFMSVITDASLTETDEAETTNVATGSYSEPEPCRSTSPSMTISLYDTLAELPSKAMSNNHETADIMDSKICSDGLSASISGSDAEPGSSDSYINGMVDPHADKLLDDSGEADVSLPSRSAAPCMKEISLLLEQAVEKGSALVLDKDSLDADNVYQTTVSFAKSAPPGPVFRRQRKVAVPKSDKQEGSTLETRETTTLSPKGKREKSSRTPRKLNFDERFLNVVPQGTLGVDELAKLLT